MKLRHALRGTAAGLLLAVCLTTPTLALTGVVDVGGSVLRVRKTASTGSAILDQLPSGRQVEIVDTATNGWYGIRLGSVKGYVSASYIKLLEEAAPVVTAEVSAVSASAAQSESAYVKVTADALNVRTGPGTGYAVADELAQGKVVKVLGAQDGWYQIGSGYIDAAYTEAATYEEALEQLYIRVTQGPLNIRSGPGTGYSKVGSLAKGRCVKVVREGRVRPKRLVSDRAGLRQRRLCGGDRLHSRRRFEQGSGACEHRAPVRRLQLRLWRGQPARRL